MAAPLVDADAPSPVASEPVGHSGRNPWWFVPSLYFLQGLPVIVVQQMSVTMYKKLGVDNAQIALFTSLLTWPWVVKMLWGPLVDRNGHKRAWIVGTQAAITLLLFASAGAILSGNFLAASLAVFFALAFVSATHDIAADGFYVLALPEDRQAFFVGIRSAFFRLAWVFSSGFLVFVAGEFERRGMPIPRTWSIALLVGGAVYGVGALYHLRALPKPAADRVIERFNFGRVALGFGQVLLMLLGLLLAGRMLVIGAAAANPLFPKPVFTKSVELTPLFLSSYPSQLADAVANFEVEEAERLALPQNRSEWGEAQVAAHAAAVKGRPRPFFSEDLVVPYAAQLALSLGVIVAAIFSTRSLFRRIGMGPAFSEYMTQSRIAVVLGFILFYRFGESMIGKLSVPFLLDKPEKGGLGVSTSVSGLLNGTIGVVALVVGGILGGLVIARHGIKRSIWPMVLSLNVPNLFYVWAAFQALNPATRPSTEVVGAIIGIDQFGYGFGFSAYMVYLMYLSQGSKQPTSHYAISTGLMALGGMVAGIVSGQVQAMTADRYGVAGYAWFFVVVCLCTLPGMLILFFLPMEKADLKVAPVEID